jgi:hypothetical protein
MADAWMKRGDTSPRLTATLEKPPGTRADIAGADVELILSLMYPGRRPGSVVLEFPANNDQAGDPTMGDVSYDWQPGDTDITGGYLFEWRVTFGDGLVETFRNAGYNTLAILENLPQEAS